MRALTLALLLATSGLVPAATFDLNSQSQATLASGQTTVAACANEADFGYSGRRGAAIFQFQNSAGTATVELQVTCLAGTTGYASILNSSTALTTVPAVLDIVSPGCRYRCNVTACTGCNLTVTVTSIAAQ